MCKLSSCQDMEYAIYPVTTTWGSGNLNGSGGGRGQVSPLDVSSGPGLLLRAVPFLIFVVNSTILSLSAPECQQWGTNGFDTVTSKNRERIFKSGEKLKHKGHACQVERMATRTLPWNVRVSMRPGLDIMRTHAHTSTDDLLPIIDSATLPEEGTAA